MMAVGGNDAGFGGKAPVKGRAQALRDIYAREEGFDIVDEYQLDAEKAKADIQAEDRLACIVDQQLLSQHLSMVSRAVNPQVGKHYPVLLNVLLRADVKSNTLALAGYDLSMGIESRINEGVNVTKSGMVAAPAKVLSDVISKLPQGDLELVCDSRALQIRVVGRAAHVYKVRVMPPSDYPALPVVRTEDIIIPAEELLEGLKGVMFACASDDAAAVLKGVHMRLLPEDDSSLVEYAATDGHRLSVQAATKPSRVCFNPVSATLPKPALQELEKLVRLKARGMSKMELSPEETSVALRVNNEHAQFVFGKRRGVWAACRVFTRLFDGVFPNYHDIVPKEFVKTFAMERIPLMEALTRLEVVARYGTGVITFHFSPADKSLELTAEASGFGRGSERVACMQLHGPAELEEFQIAFNPKYVMDGLKNMPVAQVALQCSKSNTPAVFLPLPDPSAPPREPHQYKGKYLIMPMQLPTGMGEL